MVHPTTFSSVEKRKGKDDVIFESKLNSCLQQNRPSTNGSSECFYMNYINNPTNDISTTEESENTVHLMMAPYESDDESPVSPMSTVGLDESLHYNASNYRPQENPATDMPHLFCGMPHNLPAVRLSPNIHNVSSSVINILVSNGDEHSIDSSVFKRKINEDRQKSNIMCRENNNFFRFAPSPYYGTDSRQIDPDEQNTRFQYSQKIYSRKEKQAPEKRWRSVTDPNTKKTYYFEESTRKTQWERPFELLTPEEKKKRLNMYQFFREMEQNIYKSLEMGQKIPGVSPSIYSSDFLISAPTQHEERKIVFPCSSPVPHMLTMQSSPAPFQEDMLYQFSIQDFPEQIRNQEVRAKSCPTLNFQESKKGKKEEFTLIEKSNRTHLTKPSFRRVQSHEEAKRKRTHVRRNTEGTIYVESTILSGDIKMMIRCTCVCFRELMLRSVKNFLNKTQMNASDFGTLAIFDDDPRKDNRFNLRNTFRSPVVSSKDQGVPSNGLKVQIPSLQEIMLFYLDIFHRACMGRDVIVTSFIYIERLIKATRGMLTPNVNNWKSIIFSAMHLANKVWDDLSMWNSQFSRVCSKNIYLMELFSLGRINNLERAILKCLKYKVKVTASEYAKYYFLVRSKLTREELSNGVEFKPLSMEGAKSLEVLSAKCQHIAMSKESKKRRVKSMGDVLQTLALPSNQDWIGSPGDNKNPLRFYQPPTKNVCLEHIVTM